MNARWGAPEMLDMMPRNPKPPAAPLLWGLSGEAHAGRDEVARRLVERHGFVRVAVGDEWVRVCSQDAWIDHALRVARKLLGGGWAYGEREGLVERSWSLPPRGVVLTDCRVGHDLDEVRKAGGVLVRVRRPAARGEVQVEGHTSQAEQRQISDAEFDFVIENDRDLDHLYAVVDGLVTIAQGARPTSPLVTLEMLEAAEAEATRAVTYARDLLDRFEAEKGSRS